jgi:uncharacterized flavoprotein (TIGR03862 family)
MKKHIAIIGSGPSSLMLAAMLDSTKHEVHIYERNFAVSRKFLVAGDGGFNLTHSESIEAFIERYTPSSFLKNALLNFTNDGFRSWLSNIGIETYVGTSKRVFPVKGIKPIDVLTKILNVLKTKNVNIHTQHIWMGWSTDGALMFDNNGTQKSVSPDISVFALGGSSWSKTGSDGSWTKLFSEKGILLNPFQASNCAYHVNLEKQFIEKHHGASLKNISIVCEDKKRNGEVVLTQFGIEGGAVYGLSPSIRKQLNEQGKATIFIDLKPSWDEHEILNRLSERRNRSISKLLVDKLNLNEVQIALLKANVSKEEFMDIPLLAKKIKALPIILIGFAAIDEAISTVGGIALEEVDEHFQLKKLPNNYCIGEMLDWDAPTGGYLLQACFSMGNELAKRLNDC